MQGQAYSQGRRISEELASQTLRFSWGGPIALQVQRTKAPPGIPGATRRRRPRRSWPKSPTAALWQRGMLLARLEVGLERGETCRSQSWSPHPAGTIFLKIIFREMAFSKMWFQGVYLASHFFRGIFCEPLGKRGYFLISILQCYLVNFSFKFLTKKFVFSKILTARCGLETIYTLISAIVAHHFLHLRPSKHRCCLTHCLLRGIHSMVLRNSLSNRVSLYPADSLAYHLCCYNLSTSCLPDSTNTFIILKCQLLLA